MFADAPLEPTPAMPDPMADNDSDDDMDGGWVGGPPSTAPRFDFTFSPRFALFAN